ncbi:hypothetical protein HK099_008522 [Clydaea vesicula]|uniref:Uncharacterized protein n=1 Tax=Clydaea vesicula TaxID=447962 RepID=A0AAD5TVR3_9FUNG|nr:hypothetical protein HK099_008522 [Clydaea vesicula]
MISLRIITEDCQRNNTGFIVAYVQLGLNCNNIGPVTLKFLKEVKNAPTKSNTTEQKSNKKANTNENASNSTNNPRVSNKPSPSLTITKRKEVKKTTICKPTKSAQRIKLEEECYDALDRLRTMSQKLPTTIFEVENILKSSDQSKRVHDYSAEVLKVTAKYFEDVNNLDFTQ